MGYVNNMSYVNNMIYENNMSYVNNMRYVNYIIFYTVYKDEFETSKIQKTK